MSSIEEKWPLLLASYLNLHPAQYMDDVLQFPFSPVPCAMARMSAASAGNELAVNDSLAVVIILMSWVVFTGTSGL